MESMQEIIEQHWVGWGEGGVGRGGKGVMRLVARGKRGYEQGCCGEGASRTVL